MTVENKTLLDHLNWLFASSQRYLISMFSSARLTADDDEPRHQRDSKPRDRPLTHFSCFLLPFVPEQNWPLFCFYSFYFRYFGEWKEVAKRNVRILLFLYFKKEKYFFHFTKSFLKWKKRFSNSFSFLLFVSCLIKHQMIPICQLICLLLRFNNLIKNQFCWRA